MSRWLVRAVVSATVAVVLFSIVPIGQVWQALSSARPWVWGLCLAVFVLGHTINAAKLRLLIGPEVAPFWRCLQAQFAGLAANLGLPGIAGGDLIRAAYLAPTAGTRRVALASIGDRLLDTAVLALMIAVALPFAGAPPAIADAARRGATWIVAVGLGGVVFGGVALWMLARTSLWQRLGVDQVWVQLRRRARALRFAVVMSIGVQSTFVLANVVLAQEVGVAAGVAAWFVAWPGSKLVAVLPISLGGLGVREAALVSLLAPYGASSDSVLAAGILWEGVLIVGGLAGLLLTQGVGRRTTPSANPENIA